MITTPEENNPKLTDAQVRAIDVATQRLYNIQNETNAATKTLNALKNDSVVALKDKLYQEELLADTTSQVSSAISRLNILNESIFKANESLSSINQEIASKNDILKSKEVELKGREDDISQKENELTSREVSLSSREQQVKDSEELLQDKHTKIKHFVQNI